MRLPWFPAWLKRHLARHELIGLPDPLDNFELYEGWASEFERLRITEERAEDASRKLTSRSQTKANHFHKLMGIVFDKSRDVPSGPPQQVGPDFSNPDTLSREQRLARIRLIQSELPEIEANAVAYPQNHFYALSAEFGRAELTKLVEIENAYRSQATSHRRRAVSPAPY